MRNRMASWFGLAATLVTTLGGAGQAAAQQQVKLSEGATLTISGFINATLFNDRGLFTGGFGQGQNAEWADVTQPGLDQGHFDGDIRNTRIRFDFTGQPVIGKWAPKATLEADFFGANQGLPPFGDEQPQLRDRFAFVDLSNGRTTLRIGQYWSPLFGEVPVSLTHIAFPLGYGATGMVGWRFPGVFLYHDLRPGKPMTVQLQVAAFKGSGPGVGASGVGSGEASGVPQFETRFNFAKRLGKASWNGYVVYHVDNKDVNGVGVKGGQLNGWGVETGHAVTSGKVTVHGNVYYGKNLGQQFGHITQGAGSNSVQGRIQGWGAWAQAGYDFTPRWSFWLYYGMDQPDAAKYLQNNGVALPRRLSHDTDGLIRFRAGRYALGLEYFRAVTRWNVGTRTADQYALSVLYTL